MPRLSVLRAENRAALKSLRLCCWPRDWLKSCWCYWPSFAEVFLVLHKLELIKARYIFVFGLGLIFRGVSGKQRTWIDLSPSSPKDKEPFKKQTLENPR